MGEINGLSTCNVYISCKLLFIFRFFVSFFGNLSHWLCDGCALSGAVDSNGISSWTTDKYGSLYLIIIYFNVYIANDRCL